MDRRVLLFVGFQDPKVGNAERESPRGTFRRSVPSGSCDVEAAFSRLYPGARRCFISTESRACALSSRLSPPENFGVHHPSQRKL